MSTVTSSTPPVGAAPVRHGICRLTVRIGGMDYRLRPAADAPKGFRIWTLRKLDPDGPPAKYAVASHGGEIKCTCPDHDERGAECKHIRALRAVRLIGRPLPKPKPERQSPSRKALRLHAKSAQADIAAAAPAEPARPLRSDRRAALIGLPRAEELDIRLEIGAFPVASPALADDTAGEFARGFRSAVADHLATRKGGAR